MMDSQKDDSPTPRLPDLCTDLFLLILYLRESRDLNRLDVLYDRAIALFDRMEKAATDAKIADADILDAKYAIAALIDETVRWESRLELEFFGTSIAGETFFSKLEQLRGTGVNDVLEIYYLCMIFGYEGKYVRTPEKLGQYIRDFQHALESKNVVGQLSPHGGRPNETHRRKRSGMPSWMPWAFAAACLVIGGLIFMLLNIRIGDFTEGVVHHIQRVLA